MGKEETILAITTDSNFFFGKINKSDLLQKGEGTIVIREFSGSKPCKDCEYYEVLQVISEKIVIKILEVDENGFVEVYTLLNVICGDRSKPLNEDPNSFLAHNRLPTQPIPIPKAT